MSELLNSIKDHYKKRPDQAKLTETSLASELDPSEIKEVIETLYKEKNLNLKLLASVLNSIFTQHRGVFLFSYRICQDLVKNDKNIKRKSLNGDEYFNFMINTEGKFIERISEACEDKRATVYKLSDKIILQHLLTVISTKILKEQEQQCLTIFNAYGKSSQKTSQKTSRDMTRSDLTRSDLIRPSRESVEEKNTFQDKETIGSNPEKQKLPPHSFPPEKVRITPKPSQAVPELPPYKVKASPWYQHYLKSPINEEVFNSLPEEIKSGLYAKTLQLASGVRMSNGRISDATDAKDQFVTAIEAHRQKNSSHPAFSEDDIKIEL